MNIEKRQSNYLFIQSFLLIVINYLALALVRLFSLEQINSKSGCSGNLFFSAGSD